MWHFIHIKTTSHSWEELLSLSSGNAGCHLGIRQFSITNLSQNVHSVNTSQATGGFKSHLHTNTQLSSKCNDGYWFLNSIQKVQKIIQQLNKALINLTQRIINLTDTCLVNQGILWKRRSAKDPWEA